MTSRDIIIRNLTFKDPARIGMVCFFARTGVPRNDCWSVPPCGARFLNPCIAGWLDCWQRKNVRRNPS